jgi:cytochrome b subunit of formate dehydrogenase
MKDFSKICTPARLYFAIAVIAAVFALFNGVTMMHTLWQLLFAFIWTFILGWLCDKGYTSISWFLVLLPYVLILLAMLNIYHSEDPRRLMRAVKLQGAYGREAYGQLHNSSTANTSNTTNNNVNNLFPNVPTTEDAKRTKGDGTLWYKMIDGTS